MKRMTTTGIGGASAGHETCEVTNSVTRDAGVAKLTALGASDMGGAPIEVNFCSDAPASFAPVLKDGCTVEGDTTGQKFVTVSFEPEVDYVSLKVFLQGFEKKEEVAAVKPKKVSAKTQVITDLEAENEKLRQELAEIENEKLKKKLARAKGRNKSKTE